MNIRLFGLTIDKDGAIKALKEVTDAGVTAAKEGAKNAQLYADAYREKLNRVAREYVPETIAAIERLKATERNAQQVRGASNSLPGLLTPSEVSQSVAAYDALIAKQKGLTDATEKATAAGAGHGMQLGRMRMELGTLIGSLTGTNTMLDRMAGALGAMAVGNVLVIGVMAGIAAIGYAYEKFTEQAKAAQKQAEDTRTEFEKIAHMSVQGQGEVASKLFSGDQFSTDPLKIASVQELKRQQADFAARAKMTQDFVGALGVTTKEMTRDAKESAEALKKINAELDTRQKLLASITGPGGSLVRAGTAQANADLPGFTTDAAKADEIARRTAALAAAKLATLELAAAQKIWNAMLENAREGMREDALEIQRVIAKREEEGNAIIKGTVALQDRIKATFDANEKDAAAATAAADKAQKYAGEMEALAQRGAVRIVDGFAKSFSDGFEAIFRSFSDLLARMEKEGKKSNALAGLTGALGAGLAGYQMGQSGGGGAGLFGGAISGAALGNTYLPGLGAVIGGLAGAAGGLLGAAAAHRAAAEKWAEIARAQALAAADRNYQLTSSVTDYIAGSNGDSAAQKAASENARFAKLLGDMMFAVDQAGKNIFSTADLDAAKAAHERYLKAIQDEADAVAAAAVEQERIKAQTTQRRNEDATLRILAAQNDPGLEAARIAADQRREIEDLITAKADEATIALTKQAQAAEDVARATAAATAAMEKAAAAQKAIEDINVEILRAKGDTGGADALQFQLEQQRRLDDAKKQYGDSSDYVQKLLELQQLQRDSRAAQQLIDSTGGGAGGAASRGASQAFAAVSAVVTDRTALMLVDLSRASVSILNKIETNTRNGSGGGTRVQINITRKVDRADIPDIIDELTQELNEKLGTGVGRSSLFSGTVSR